MKPNLKRFKTLFFMSLVIITTSVFGQKDEDEWRLLASLGVNNPIDDVANDGYYAKDINFPTVNLGVQHMFSRRLGARLDYGFNRAENDEGSLPFKLNYSRVNLQGVYKISDHLPFLPPALELVAHAGPGLSITKPLGYDTQNTYSYLNVMGGLEIGYVISRTFSVFTDVSYVLSLAGNDKYDPAVDGFSFNGDLFYVSVGISVSLKNCNHCD